MPTGDARSGRGHLVDSGRASRPARTPARGSRPAPRARAAARRGASAAHSWRRIARTRCRERRGEAGLGDDVGLGGARELLELGAVAVGDRGCSVAALARRSSRRSGDATSQFTGPGDCEHADHLREVEVAPPNGTPTGRTDGCGEARPARFVVLGIRRVARLRAVRHAASLWTCSRSPSPAPRASSAAPAARVLGADPEVARIVGIDVREPPPARARPRVPPRRHRRRRAQAAARGRRRARAPRLGGRSDPRRGAHGAGERRGHAARARCRRRGRRPQGRPGVERGGLRRVAEQPGAAHRGRAAPAEPRLLARGAGRGGRAPARRVARRPSRASTVTTLRTAPVLGPGAERLPSRLLLGRPPLRVARRGAAGPGRPRRRPRRRARAGRSRGSCRARSTSRPTAGSTPTTARALLPRSVVPAAARASCSSARSARIWASGLGDVPPGVVPYLVHPWVVANDRLRRARVGARAHQRGGDPRRRSRHSLRRRRSPVRCYAAAARRSPPVPSRASRSGRQAARRVSRRRRGAGRATRPTRR